MNIQNHDQDYLVFITKRGDTKTLSGGKNWWNWAFRGRRSDDFKPTQSVKLSVDNTAVNNRPPLHTHVQVMSCTHIRKGVNQTSHSQIVSNRSMCFASNEIFRKGKMVGFLEILFNISWTIWDAAWCDISLPGADHWASPPDWMLAAAFHVRARGRRREGAEVEWQGSGGGPGGVPAPESVKHLNNEGRDDVGKVIRCM